jgi:hypothetical protein
VPRRINRAGDKVTTPNMVTAQVVFIVVLVRVYALDSSVV